MSGKFAIIIGNTEYSDPGLAQLTAPGKDAEDFARVLKDTEIGAFDQVNIVLNQSSSASIEAIDEFFDQRMPDDLLVLYFSGHGVRDELGALYLAVKNTIRSRLRSTAIKSDYIREAMDQSRSRRQVLVLDCCNSGAFAQGTKAATGVSIGTASAFEGGFGRVILTASDSTQFAWEGDKVIGETDNSLFTHYLVEGLEGKADRNGDGQITVDELYDYAYEKVRLATPKQTPSKFSTRQQGEIVLRQNIRIEDIKPIPLPDDLITATKSSLPFVREGAVRQLEDLLKGRNRGLARSAREALERIVEEDDSRTISRAAFQALEAVKQAEAERLAKLEAERIAEEERRVREQAERKAEAERIAKVRLEEERKTKAEAERLAAQKAEKERLAKLKAERLAEEKRRADEMAERKVKEEVVFKESEPNKTHWLKLAILGMGIIALVLLGFTAQKIFRGSGATATQAPAYTEAPATEAFAIDVPATEPQTIEPTISPSETPPPTQYSPTETNTPSTSVTRIKINSFESVQFSTEYVGSGFEGVDCYYTDTDIASPQFWANNNNSRGIIDLGNLGSIALNQVAPPPDGYDDIGGVFAIVGHVYVVLAEPGHYAVFRVVYIEPDKYITIDFYYF